MAQRHLRQRELLRVRIRHGLERTPFLWRVAEQCLERLENHRHASRFECDRPMGYLPDRSYDLHAEARHSGGLLEHRRLGRLSQLRIVAVARDVLAGVRRLGADCRWRHQCAIGLHDILHPQRDDDRRYLCRVAEHDTGHGGTFPECRNHRGFLT